MSVAEQAGLGMTWLEAPKTGFFATRPIKESCSMLRSFIILAAGLPRNSILSVIIYINCSIAQLPYKHCLSHSMCLYQVMMTLQFLNDDTNDAESTQKSIITSYSRV